MKKFFTLFIFILFCFSCKETTTYGRTEFPDIYIKSYILKELKGFNFIYNSKSNGTIEVDYGKVYLSSEISFLGEALAHRTYEKNDKLNSDIISYLYSLDYIDNQFIDYLINTFESIKIFSDEDFNGVKAGENLNSFFIVTGDFILYKDKKYSIFNKNILETSYIQEGKLLFPLNMKISLKVPPKRIDRYKFYLELRTTDGEVYSSMIADIPLR